MRLIDADALEKEMCSGCEYNKNKYANCDDCAIANAPTIDTAETKTKCVARIEIDTEEIVRRIKEEYDIIDEEQVVRCKDCKHNEGGTCGYSEFDIEVDDYCSFGERREP